MTIENPFPRMLTLFRNGEGWTKRQGVLALEDGSWAYCSMGVLGLCLLVNRELWSSCCYLLAETITEQYPDRIIEEAIPITHFNDHPATTFDDVRVVFEKASLKFDQLQSLHVGEDE